MLCSDYECEHEMLLSASMNVLLTTNLVVMMHRINGISIGAIQQKDSVLINKASELVKAFLAKMKALECRRLSNRNDKQCHLH